MLGFVYKLRCLDETIKEIYVGSSFNINHRMTQHKSDCNNPNRINYNYKVYKFIRDNGGWSNWDYTILEEVEVEDKDELEICYEDSWIVYLDPQLNSQRARRSQKEYREDNKEKIAEYKKEYYEKNKEKALEYRKEYRERNREIISEKQREKFNCECGGRYTRVHKSRHQKSKKHQAFENNKKIEL